MIKNLLNFLVIARGSLAELYTQLTISVEIGFLQQSELDKLDELMSEIGKMINGLKRSLTTKD